MKEKKIQNFDPSGYAVDNGNFIGLPFTEAEAQIVLVPAPWEVTVSSQSGTLKGAENIRQCSLQLDLLDEKVADAWKIGLFIQPTDSYWAEQSDIWRTKAAEYIDFLEQGGDLANNADFQQLLAEINEQCRLFKTWIHDKTRDLLQQGKLVGLIGGDHSTPLGYLEALAEQHDDFGILQIDAHCDLRDAYEGFTYSHASIFYNALAIPAVSKLVQVGIRDYCEAEVAVVEKEGGRIELFTDQQIQHQRFEGATFQAICQNIIANLPQKVYISFDIDGLDPKLCPNTGTPVPGGFEFSEATYLIQQIVLSGRTIIGFDLSEVNGESEWDGNVGARMAYALSNLMGSQLIDN